MTPRDWLVAAASVTGAGHLSSGESSQDAFAWRVSERGALVVVVCDGMGSSKRGGPAARFVADSLCGEPSLDEWLSIDRSESDWRVWTEKHFAARREGLEALAASADPPEELHEFACTVQLVVATDTAVFVAHVGDGRAAGRFDGSDEWRALYAPDRGDLPNETVPLSSRQTFDHEYWKGAAFRLDGRANAITVMTDGCENGSFECYIPDEAGQLHDPNRPFPGFFNPVAATLKSFARQGTPQSEVDAKWESFLRDGLPRFATESDDRTMVFGVTKD